MKTLDEAILYIQYFFARYYGVKLTDADQKKQFQELQEELQGYLQGLITQEDEGTLTDEDIQVRERYYESSTQQIDMLFTHLWGSELYATYLRGAVTDLIMQCIDIEYTLPSA